MVKLSKQEYRLRLGLPEAVLDKDISKHLVDTTEASMGTSSVEAVVEVLGTVETQDLQLLVRTVPFKEIV